MYNVEFKIKAISIMMPVKKTAFRGSLDLDFAAKIEWNGTVFCSAKACRTLGAPNILPRAEDNVAPMIPAMTAGPQNALSTMII